MPRKLEFSNLLCRAAAVGASAGHGIIGTSDGLVYMWELSTGTKLAMLHHFRGMFLSCQLRLPLYAVP